MHKDLIGVAVVEADGAKQQSGLIANRSGEDVQALERAACSRLVAFAFKAVLTDTNVAVGQREGGSGRVLVM